MKNFVLLLALSLISLNIQSQDLCTNLQEGKFVILNDDGSESKYIITRRDGLQTEYSPSGLVIQFKIKWIENCSYILTFDKILENPNKIAFPDNAVFTVKILSKTNQGYVQETTANYTKRVMKAQVKILKT